MRGALRFLSIATLTQLLLVLNQLVLLPLQLRIWGSETTAHWNVAIAAAALILAADLGLRTTGHAALLRHFDDRSDRRALGEFEVSWTGIRLLLIVAGAVLIGASMFWHPGGGDTTVAWPTLLVFAIWLEALMVARIMYLDTIGRYVEAELAYTAMLVCRLAASIGALLIFKAGPGALAIVHVGAAAAAILIQSLFCRDLPFLSLLSPFHVDQVGQMVALARIAAAEPLSLWLRLNLPVLVLATIAAPILVTTYVALRAIFGLVRNLVQQVARYTSVEQALERSGDDDVRASRTRVLLTGVITVAAAAAGVAVLIDHLRLVGRLLPGLDLQHYSLIATCFALPTAFVAYQLVQAQLMRAGRTAVIARRQYAYAALALVVALVGRFAGSADIYLPLAGAAELSLALLFLRLDRGAHRPGVFAMAISGAIAIVGVAALVEVPVDVFSGRLPTDVVASVAAWVLVTLALVAIAARACRPVAPHGPSPFRGLAG